jgi:hypothetical protein
VSDKCFLVRIDEKMKSCLAAENLVLEDSRTSAWFQNGFQKADVGCIPLYRNIVTPFQPHLGLEMVQKGYELSQSPADQLRSGIFPKRDGRLR